MSADTLAPFGRARASLAGRTIMQVIPRLDAGGAERTTIDVADALVRAGARALVASEGGRLASELQAIGGVLLPFPAATKNPLSMLLNVRKLARLMMPSASIWFTLARARPPGFRWAPAGSPSGLW